MKVIYPLIVVVIALLAWECWTVFVDGAYGGGLTTYLGAFKRRVDHPIYVLGASAVIGIFVAWLAQRQADEAGDP